MIEFIAYVVMGIWVANVILGVLLAAFIREPRQVPANRRCLDPHDATW